jgi:flagellar basal body-associated protein FliL
MADEKASNEGEAKKGLPIKTIIIILIMMVAEAAVIIGAISFLGKPSDVQATGLADTDPMEEVVEIPVLAERFVNKSTGRAWLWDTEVVVKVKRRHAEEVRAKIDQRRAEIRTAINSIWATAQDAYFHEPGRATLSRQVLEYFHDTFGEDPVTEEPLIQDVLIPKCLGFPSDV